VSDVVHAVMSGPQWRGTALFLTYDEHGGIYDHVAPPEACAPDDSAPKLEKGDVGVAGDFKRLGFRVPLVVVSPFAKKGYVSHLQYDHSSITRFIETKFRLPALSKRDANADPLLDMFDFANPPFVTPPDLPVPSVDQAEVQYCASTFAR
jgi:phospholipase C